jgi:hypothetical protein
MTVWETYWGAIEIVKAISWPVAAAFVIWWLRDELRAAAKRLTEIGPSGAKFAPPEITAQMSVEEKIGALGVEKTGEIEVVAHNVQAFIGQVKSFISDDQLQPQLPKIRSALSAVAGDNLRDQVEALIYNSASLNVQLGHEKVYNGIFGSQLTLLAQANGEGGLIPALARQLYEQVAKPTNPALYATYTFEQWIGFLINSGLLQEVAGNYALTNYGRGFLKYIVDRHLTVFKPN